MSETINSKKSLICPDSKVELNRHFMGLGSHPRRAQRKITETINAMLAQNPALSRRAARTLLQKSRGLR